MPDAVLDHLSLSSVLPPRAVREDVPPLSIGEEAEGIEDPEEHGEGEEEDEGEVVVLGAEAAEGEGVVGSEVGEEVNCEPEEVEHIREEYRYVRKRSWPMH